MIALNTEIGSGIKTYVLHFADGWFPLDMADDDEAIATAKINPGCTKVTREPSGEVVWRKK